MLQFYLLSVVFNALAGYLFVFKPKNATVDFSALGASKTFCLVVGLCSAVTGVLKLLSPSGGAIIVGDLIPALANLLGGACLLFDYYQASSSMPLSLGKKIEDVLVTNRKYAGIFILAAAFLHFLLPTVLFL